MPPLNKLRDYQLEPIRAVLDSIEHERGDEFCLEFARQSGKNETSAQLEALLLTVEAERFGMSPDIIKVSPTRDPQAKISQQRLNAICRQAGVRFTTEGHITRAGHGQARFLSAEPGSNIVGHTAVGLLELDETQDIDAEKYSHEIAPFRASTNATTVAYGTAWSDLDLLHQFRQRCLTAERADGRRRSFIVPWLIPAATVPAYKQFVESERDRLGEDHPLFRSQYLMEPIEGAGHLLTPTLIEQLRGEHKRARRRPTGAAMVAAGLDVGGGEGTSANPDLTVLTIAVVTPPSTFDAPGNYMAVMDQVAWQGIPHDQLLPAILDRLKAWRVNMVSVDITGLGQTIGRLIATSLGSRRADLLHFTRVSKSQLGFDLQSSLGTGRLKFFADDGSDEHTLTFEQAALARQELMPGNYIDWHVDESDGHDDHLVSLALCNRAAGLVVFREARGRKRRH